MTTSYRNHAATAVFIHISNPRWAVSLFSPQLSSFSWKWCFPHGNRGMVQVESQISSKHKDDHEDRGWADVYQNLHDISVCFYLGRQLWNTS